MHFYIALVHWVVLRQCCLFSTEAVDSGLVNYSLPVKSVYPFILISQDYLKNYTLLYSSFLQGVIYQSINYICVTAAVFRLFVKLEFRT